MMYGLTETKGRSFSKELLVSNAGWKRPGLPPAQTASVRGDVDAAVGQVGGDGHKLVDKTCPAHQPEGAHQLLMISDHTKNVTWWCNTSAWTQIKGKKRQYLSNYETKTSKTHTTASHGDLEPRQSQRICLLCYEKNQNWQFFMFYKPESLLLTPVLLNAGDNFDIRMKSSSVSRGAISNCSQLVKAKLQVPAGVLFISRLTHE